MTTGRFPVFAIVMAVQFGLLEAALRTWGSSEAAPAFQGLFINDPAIGYGLKPGARVQFATAEFDTGIAINSSGVRDDEEIGPKGADERRTLVLGDRALPGPDLFFQQTVHLTPRGHEVVAEVLERFLRESGLVRPLAGRESGLVRPPAGR